MQPGAHEFGWRVHDDAVAQVDGQAGGGLGRDVAREEGHEAQVWEEPGDAASFHPLQRVELVECHEELQRGSLLQFVTPAPDACSLRVQRFDASGRVSAKFQ